jgi:hypothetical protein
MGGLKWTTKPARAVYRGCEEELNVHKPKSMTTPRIIIMNAFNQQRGEIDFRLAELPFGGGCRIIQI